MATVRKTGLKNFRISEFQPEKPASKSGGFDAGRSGDSGVSHNSVALLRGHKSLKSLDTYAVTTQRQMSKILSGKENSKPKPKQSAKPVQRKHCSRVHPNTWHIFRSKHWCDKHPESCPSRNLLLQTSFVSQIAAQKKRCHRVIEPADEEDWLSK